MKDPGPGTGGFAPFGVRGVLHGASEAFFAFIGMINVATMSEEAIHPERDIPLAIIITSVLTYLTYLGVGIGLTMMAPYYQLVNIDVKFKFFYIFTFPRFLNLKNGCVYY